MDDLKALYDRYHFPPQLIWNMDETMMEVGSGKCKVITTRSAPRPHNEVPSKSEHITLVLAISAAGDFARPLCIFPLKTLPPLDPRTQAFYFISGQDNGFIDSQLYYNWVVVVFIPKVQETRATMGLPANYPALLLVDPHSTRIYEPAVKQLEAAHIVVFCLLAHSSTISQPLDLCPHKEFKRGLQTFFKPHPHESKEEKRIRLLNASVLSLQIALAGAYIMNGFARAGIWPYSCEAPLKSGLVIDPFDNPNPEKPAKRRRGPRISGRILTNGIDVTPAFPALPPPPPKIPLLPPQPPTEDQIEPVTKLITYIVPSKTV